MGLWESVNDARVQADEECFRRVIEYIRERTAGVPVSAAHYLTRPWNARKPQDEAAPSRFRKGAGTGRIHVR